MHILIIYIKKYTSKRFYLLDDEFSSFIFCFLKKFKFFFLMSNQTFPVIYGSRRYMVDPNKLFNASRKFAQLVQPFGSDANRCQLGILVNNFSDRCVDNFLKLCQDLPTDVLDSEMKEICELAKMFQTDKIYNTGLAFVQQSIDPNFYVPDSKYENGIEYIRVELPYQSAYINDMDYESDETNEASNSENQNKEPEAGIKHDIPTIIYEIRIDRPKLKLIRYHLMKDGEVIYSAKKKGNKVVIGKGADVHMETSTINHCGHITQDSMINQINVDNQMIRLQYIRFPESDSISMSVSFMHNGQTLSWSPREPKRNPINGSYGLNLRGYYHHKAVASKRNSVLKNAAGHATFITRKMAENFYEAECHPEINPLVAFAIALSSIIGPSLDKAQ